MSKIASTASQPSSIDSVTKSEVGQLIQTFLSGAEPLYEKLGGQIPADSEKTFSDYCVEWANYAGKVIGNVTWGVKVTGVLLNEGSRMFRVSNRWLMLAGALAFYTSTFLLFSGAFAGSAAVLGISCLSGLALLGEFSSVVRALLSVNASVKVKKEEPKVSEVDEKEEAAEAPAVVSEEKAGGHSSFTLTNTLTIASVGASSLYAYSLFLSAAYVPMVFLGIVAYCSARGLIADVYANNASAEVVETKALVEVPA